MTTMDLSTLPAFRNEPFTDFSTAENTAAMRAALAGVRAQLGQSYELLIGGRDVSTGRTFASVNPARPAEVIGVHAEAGAAEALSAIDGAQAAFATWGRTPVAERVALLLRADPRTGRCEQDHHRTRRID